ncbi:MAG: TIGR03084 family metal-binding protein [Pseudomonadota bacterium]
MSTPPGAAAQAQIDAFEADAAQLAELVNSLEEADWQRVTLFKDWRVWDVIAHLHFTDHMGLTTLAGPEPFKALLKDMGSSGQSMATYVRDKLGDISGAELSQRWQAGIAELLAGLRAADPEVRLTWPGPGMKPRMFATARQMETWAHGTEVFDLFNAPRSYHDRIENIVTIGARTYGWSFSNRKMTVPETVPHLSLTAPSGALWMINPEREDECIRGSAVGFCQVVTQVRNVQDTDLIVTGDNASAWMAIAQCFAGPPADPPAPGARGGTQ